MGLKIKQRFLLSLGLFLVALCQVSVADEQLHVVTTIKPLHSILAGLMAGTEGPELLLEEDATTFWLSTE